MTEVATGVRFTYCVLDKHRAPRSSIGSNLGPARARRLERHASCSRIVREIVGRVANEVANYSVVFVVMAKGQPVSVRLSRDAELLVDDERRRSGRSRSAVIEELAEEAAKTRLFPGIAFRGPEPRRPWVIGTGLDVWELVELYRSYGDLAAILRDFPLVSEAAVRLALAYAERFAAEVESAISENSRPPEELAEIYPFIEFLGHR